MSENPEEPIEVIDQAMEDQDVPPHYQGIVAKPRERTRLSRFARKRIDTEILMLRGRTDGFEFRRSSIPIWWSIGKKNYRRWFIFSVPTNLHKLIELRIVLLLAALGSLAAGIIYLPLGVTDATPKQIAGDIACLLLVALVLAAACYVYVLWATWFFWRIVVFYDQIVIINKPLLMPGGGVWNMAMKQVRIVTTSTSEDSAIQDSESIRFTDVVKGWFRMQYLHMDTNVQNDWWLQLTGLYFRTAPRIKQIIDHFIEMEAIAAVRTDEETRNEVDKADDLPESEITTPCSATSPLTP